MKTPLIALLLAAGCATPSAQRPAPDLSAGGQLAVVPAGQGSARYLIDPTSRSCFLFVDDRTPAGSVNCHELAERIPAAQEHVTWERYDPLQPLLEAMERMLPRAERPEPAPRVEGIEQRSEDTFDIKQATVDKWLENPTLVSRQARLVPSVTNGKPDGFKLYAIRPGSMYSALGLKNGDTILSINGHRLTSPDRALEAYTKVRNAKTLRLEIRRRGTLITITYNIVP